MPGLGRSRIPLQLMTGYWHNGDTSSGWSLPQARGFMQKSKLPYPATCNKIIDIMPKYNIHIPPIQQLNLNMKPVIQYTQRRYMHETVREGVL